MSNVKKTDTNEQTADHVFIRIPNLKLCELEIENENALHNLIKIPILSDIETAIGTTQL